MYFTELAFITIAGYTLDISSCILFSLLITGSVFDLLKGVIPNGLVLTGIAASVGLMLFDRTALPDIFLAALGVGLLLLFIRWLGVFWFNKPGMGMGDVKLFTAVALYLGWSTFWLIYLSVMLAGLFSLVLLVLGVLDRKSHIPFAPFITIAAVINLYWQPWTYII
jgi:prepilin signal peptidase PulO-like enzyme (type II secretory pathway)